MVGWLYWGFTLLWQLLKVIWWRSVTHTCFLNFSHEYNHEFLSKPTNYFSHMLQRRWEAKKIRKEISPQMSLELTTTRLWDRHAHHWATRAGLTSWGVYIPNEGRHFRIEIWRQTKDDRKRERESVCVQVLTVRCLTLFSTLFKFYRGSHCTYPYFMKFLFTSTLHNILSEPLAAFHKAIIKIMGSGERGVNAVAKIIISPQKEYRSRWGSDQWSPVLKSSMLPTAQTTNKCILSPALFTF